MTTEPTDPTDPTDAENAITAESAHLPAVAPQHLRYFDLKTGKTVWQDVLPAGGQAAPMTYEVNGRQYVAIMAGGHHFMETPIGDAVIAYALPAR